MQNKKNSYYRISRFAFIVIISVVVILGVISVSTGSALFKRAKLNDLKQTGDIFINCLTEEYNITGTADSKEVRALHSAFMHENELRIYVYDQNGKCILSADENAFMPPSADMQRSVMKKYYLDIDSKNISEDEPRAIYGTYFSVQKDGQSFENMYMFIYGETYDINIFTMQTAFVYIVITALGLLISYIFIRIRTKKYTAYEEDFRRISEQYSKGNFSEKIPADVVGVSGEIAAYVNTLASNVEKSEDTSKTFIANVSHELRTPMTTIGGFVDGILDGTIPKTRRNEYLILVSNEIQRLKILINSMLNMSRFESGTLRPNFKETNLTELVIKTVFLFEKKIEEKHLEVEELDSERLIAVVDADLIQQVIYNLIENAVKFVNEGGTLSFKFEKEDGMCTIGIKNTGEGLQDSEIPQVFDRFYKTDSSRGKDTTGLGLGLSISRKIVHLHNGHIVVKSVYGEYTEFLVQIPEKQAVS